jgi:phage major head subunit gpT-like protein
MGTPVYSPQQLRKDVSGLFIESLMTPPSGSLVSRIATEVQSNSDKENYAWLGDAPAMVEFSGQLQHKQLSESAVDDVDGISATAGAGYELVNKTFEATLCLKREDLDDEKTMGLQQRVKDMSARAMSNPDKLLIDKLVLGGGATGTCYLGTAATAEYAFSATHAARGQQTSTWSNLYTRSGTSTATAQADISGAIGYLYNMLDEAGEPMNEGLSSLFILYPPAMNQWITEAVNAGVVSSTSNVQFSANKIELIQCPRLTGTSAANYYIGFNDPGIVRGLIYQNRQNPQLEEIGQGSDTWTNLRQVVYSVNSRGVAGFGKVQRLVYVYA